MMTRTTCLRQEPRASLANPATMIVVAMITAMTFSASGAAPTPLYHLYQEHFGLTPALVTVIFAAYVLSLLLALLTTGALSDHVGRRPTVLGALMLNIIAMVLFITCRFRRRVDCRAGGAGLCNRCRDRSSRRGDPRCRPEARGGPQ